MIWRFASLCIEFIGFSAPTSDGVRPDSIGTCDLTQAVLLSGHLPHGMCSQDVCELEGALYEWSKMWEIYKAGLNACQMRLLCERDHSQG
jgi:hypothetical protein